MGQDDPFDPAVVETVAVEHELDPAGLRALDRRLQEHADSMPGVDELVMEWRRFRPRDPLVGRTDDAYLLAVAASVWTEFGEQLGFTGPELAALRAFHDRQARATGEETAPFDERAALLLAR